MLASVKQSNLSQPTTQKRRFGNEGDVESLTGLSRKTLQKHRLFGKGFPFYRVGSRVLYDLDEVEQIIRASRVSPEAA